MLDNALDCAVLAGSIPTLQNDQNFVVAIDKVSLQCFLMFSLTAIAQSNCFNFVFGKALTQM